MSRHQKFVVVVCSCVTILFLTFTLLIVASDANFQLVLPDFSFQESPYRWLETTLEQNLPGRDLSASLCARTELLLGQKCVNNVCIQDGRLVECLEKPQANASFEVAEKIRAYAENCNARVYFLAVPTAVDFLQEQPASAPSAWSQRVFIKELVGQLSGYIHELDIYAELADAVQNDIWFQTETLWTSEGAYIGYRAFANAVGLYPQPLSKFNLEVVSYDFSGALQRRLYDATEITDRIDLYYDPHTSDASSIERYGEYGAEKQESVYAREWLESEEQDNVFLGEDCALIRIQTVVANDRRLLIIGDDFADVICPFFLRNYGQIDLIKPSLLTEETAALVRTEQYNAVLMVLGVNTLTDSHCVDHLSMLYE